MSFDAAALLDPTLALSVWLVGLWLAAALTIIPLAERARRLLKVAVGLVCALDGLLLATLFFGVLGAAPGAIHGPLLVGGLFAVVPLPSLWFDPPPPRSRRLQRNVARFGLAYLWLTSVLLCAVTLIPFGDVFLDWCWALVQANPLLFGVLAALTLGSLASLKVPPPPAFLGVRVAVGLIGLWLAALLTLMGALASAAFPR